MNKKDILLQMMQQPGDYSAEEWQEMLADDECRELYTIMAKIESLQYSAMTDDAITDDTISAEWERLTDSHKKAKYEVFYPQYHKIAASFAGLLFVSGIAFAAIHFVRQLGEYNTRQPVKAETIANTADDSAAYDVLADSIAVEPVIYDNIPLEKMLQEIADAYRVRVEFRNDEVRNLRFHFTWNPQSDLEDVISNLNHFEHLHLTLVDNILIVE